ncbi:MAG: UDP-N-acetylmuramoyl-L-alanine--D-glutamate ligase [Bacteroidota bacterium]
MRPPIRPDRPSTREALAAAVPSARVTVVGGARSGLAVARLLRRRGAEVFLSDHGAPEAGVAEGLDAAGIASEFGGHTARALDADWLVVSPGVPTTSNLIQSALRQRRPVYSEIEAASWFCRGPIAAVTGSNGKTTTTSLIGHLFATAGREHVVAGNIGYPLSDYVDDVGEETAVVLEVSSFQLDHIHTFRPRVAVLLNITPDHLDRYDHDVAQYAAAKLRLFANLQPGDWLVANHDDALVRESVAALPAGQGLSVAFSADAEPVPGAFVRDDRVVLALPTAASRGGSSPHPVIDHEDLMPTSDLALPGRHNLYNSLAAAIVARAMEIRSDVVRESLTSFEGVPHRLETVRTVGGVTFVNDSKATNVNAVWYALESFPGRVVLIAGGRDKGNDYGPLQRLVADKVTGLVAIGEGADAIEAALGPYTEEVARAGSMEQAIQYARLMAQPGDTVLLSPACSSFDMFENYEDRGDTFKRLVRAL